MIDNDQNNEEYKLDDLDLLASEPEDQLRPEVDALSTPSVETIGENPKPVWENPMIRNGLIAVGCLVLLVMCYQLISSLFSGKHSTENQIKPVTVTKQVTVSQPVMNAFPNAEPDTSKLDKKLSTIEQDQNVMSSNIQTINGQMTAVSSSISDIATKMAELNNTLSAMSEKVDAQSQEITRLVALNAKKQRPIVTRKVNTGSQEVASIYSLQAVIPGRAWLMSSNGATMTVREGTSIAGYGVVKLIDPQQGRVITSSGRTIRFSQVDS